MQRPVVRRAILAAGVLAVAVAALAVFHDAATGMGLRAVAAAFGYPLAYDGLHAGPGGATVTGVRVTNRAGEPVFSADRIDVRYALRDFFPGSRHLYGISVLEVARPQLTLIHHADGTYNVAMPSNPANQQPNHTPLALRARIRDGSALLIDRYVVPGHERRQRIVGLAFDLAFAPHERSFYTAKFDLDDGRTTHPVTGKATFDDDRGYEAQRWDAKLLPIGPLVDFTLNSHVLNLVDGDLRNVDARFYTVVDPAGVRHESITARAQLERGKLYVTGLVAPVRDAHGPLVLFDDGLTTTGVDATLAGAPLHLTGGIYGWKDPRIDFSLEGAGPLRALRRIATATQHEALAGDVTFLLRGQGHLAQPFVSGSFVAPSITYRGYTIGDPSGSVAVLGRTLDLLDVRGNYGRLALAARGRLQLEKAVDTDVVVSVAGDPSDVPYAAQLVNGVGLNATVHLRGTGAQLASDGVVYGDGRGGALSGIFALDANGNGVVGPLAFERRDGASVYARVTLDRTHQTAAGIVDVHRLSLLALPHASRFAGSLEAHAVGSIGGDGAAAIGTVALRSPLGNVDGTASASGSTIAFDGRIATSFEQLRPLSGDVGAHGGIVAPLRGLADSGTYVVQTPRIAFAHASIRGIGLHDGEATIVSRAGVIDVRAARLGIAGGNIVAQGTIGEHGDIRAIGAVPINGGRLTAVARLRGPLADPRGNIGVALAGAQYAGAPVAADVLAQYGRGRLTVHDAVVLAAGAIVSVGGNVAGLERGKTPSVDLRGTVRGAEIATLARLVRTPLRYPDGELDADLHVTGPAQAPRVAGEARIVRGSINGLGFSDARVAISGGLGELTARDGRVTVGSTEVAFSGTFGRALAALSVRAPHANLADFNDAFDQADTFAGRGHVAIDADLGAATTTGDIAFTGARFRQFTLGDVGANWHTAGRDVAATGHVTGPHGTATLAGTLTLPADPRRDPFRRSTIAADAKIAGLDIGAWLTTAGINAPVNGILDASAHASGAPATPAFTASATVRNGVVGHYALDRFEVAASGDRSGARIERLDLAGPALLVNAHGTFGYGAHDPLALAVHAQSDDLAQLAKKAGLVVDVAGSATTDLTLGGTRSAPRLAQTLAATDLTLHGYRVPRVAADLVADPQSVSLSSATVDLQKGRMLVAGAVPIAVTPAGIALREAPLNARLQAESVDLAQFASLLPKGSHLAGIVAGTVTAGGTARAPSLGGGLALSGGNFSSPLVRSPLANMRAQLAFAGTEAKLSGLHADINGGTLDVAGSASVGDLRDPMHALAFDVNVTTSHARFDIANGFAGKVDSSLHATQARGGVPNVSGTVAISQARIPLSAVIPPSKPAPATTPLPIGFALGISLGDDVRLQSQNVDIGARGRVAIAGTLAQPQLSGEFSSTDGTLSFYRTFVLQRGRVAFSPADGIVPNVDATATTTIPDPATTVLLHVTGPATHLNLELASEPSYDRAQILGLLVNAQAFGAVQGVATTGSGSGVSAVGLAGGYLSQTFTRQLLQPIGGEVGRSLGLSDLALGYDINAGVTVGATRKLGKHLDLSVNQSLGADQRQSLALEAHLKSLASVQLSVFGSSAQATQALPLTSPVAPYSPTGGTNLQLEALAPAAGSSGFVVTYLRKFK